MKSKKLKVLLVFGGASGEHEVSLESAASVFGAMDLSVFDVTLLGVSKGRKFFYVDPAQLDSTQPQKSRDLLAHSESLEPVFWRGDALCALNSGAFSDFHPDVVFSLMHGTGGEDGAFQGFCESIGLPYVGSGVLASALCMDKDMAKQLLGAQGLPLVDGFCVGRSEFRDLTVLKKKAESAYGYPFFVKAANMGSSVGVARVEKSEEFEAAIAECSQYDHKLLIERAVHQVRELEVAVLGTAEKARCSCVGEIRSKHSFYSYEAKYLDSQGAELLSPAPISDELTQQLQNLALKAYRALGCAGMARVDFFLDPKTQEVYLNELNTLPGFTSISMYPRLWQQSGLSYAELLAELIKDAMERHVEKSQLKRSFSPRKT